MLVTGVNGFTASWLTKRLIDCGAAVAGIALEDNPLSELFLSGYDRRIEVLWGDLKDRDFLETAFQRAGFEYCFHLAAQTIVGKAHQDPWDTMENNIKGAYNLLEAARHRGGLAGFIFTSSDKAYGAQTELPYRETQPLKAVYPYDVSKACGEHLAFSYHQAYGLPVVVSRCGNIYGGGDRHISRIVPDTVMRAIKGECPVIRSDGTPTRDYIYVEDVARVLMLLAESIGSAGVSGQAFNFSGERPFSVLEIVHRILEVAGRTDLKVRILGRGVPEGEIPHQYLDCTKAKEVLGFEPEIGLDEGLARTVEWYRRFGQAAAGADARTGGLVHG